MEAVLSESQKVISQILANVPQHHHRPHRKKFQRISPQTSLATLRDFYRIATGDQSPSLTTAEEELDERLHEALEMEDPDLMVDLGEMNKGDSDKFAVFWDKMRHLQCTKVGMVRSHTRQKQSQSEI